MKTDSTHGAKVTRSIDAGFSLIELVVAMAVVALLAGFAVPSFLSWQISHRLRGAATNLVGDLEMAKIRAIRENTFVAVIFSQDSYSIFVDNGEGGGSAGDWTRNGMEALVQHRWLPSGVTIDLTGITLPDSRVRFNGKGFPLGVTLPETIPIVNASGRKSVALTRLGSVRIQ
jgi:prepilin-type N-terminal cleavage/methylation domain-containing protein